MKILISKFAGIGDVFLTTPAVRALKEKFPDSKIFYLTNKNGYVVLKDNPYIDELFIFDKDTWRIRVGPISFLPIRQYHKVYKSIYNKINSGGKIDILFDWNKSYSGFCAIKYIKAKTKVGFNLTGRRCYVNYFYHYLLKDKEECYQSIRFLKTLEPFGINAADIKLDYYYENKFDILAKKFLTESKVNTPFLLIGPTTKVLYKQWPVDRFVNLYKILKKQYNFSIVLFGGTTLYEQKTIEYINNNISEKLNWIPFDFPLEAKAAILKQAKLFITNDTGLKYFSIALNVPTVTIFSYHSVICWHPPNDEKHIAISEYNSKLEKYPKNKKKDDYIIRRISVQDVVNAIDRILKKGSDPI